MPTNSSFPSQLSEEGRQLTFVEPLENKHLDGHVIHNSAVTNAEICEIKCFLNRKCLSYNLGPLEGGAHICELCDLDYRQGSGNLVTRLGFYHYPTNVGLLMRYNLSFRGKRYLQTSWAIPPKKAQIVKVRTNHDEQSLMSRIDVSNLAWKYLVKV